jgi:hypothetical protein
MVSDSRACLTSTLSDHPHWPSPHFGGALDVTLLTDDFETPGVGIVVDRDDRLFVVDYSAGEVKRVSRDGDTTTVARGLSSPVGLVFDPEGQLYTATWGDGAIHAVTAE